MHHRRDGGWRRGLLAGMSRWLRSARSPDRAWSSRRVEEAGDAEAEFRPGLQPLASLPAESCAVVRQLVGGRWFNARLAGMGLTPNAELKVVQNFGHGPVLVDVRSTRLALGRREASRILVEAKEDV